MPSLKPAGSVDLRTRRAWPSPGQRVGQGFSVGPPAAAAPPAGPRDKRPFFHKARRRSGLFARQEKGAALQLQEGGWRAEGGVLGGLPVSVSRLPGQRFSARGIRGAKCTECVMWRIHVRTGGVTPGCRCDASRGCVVRRGMLGVGAVRMLMLAAGLVCVTGVWREPEVR